MHLSGLEQMVGKAMESNNSVQKIKALLVSISKTESQSSTKSSYTEKIVVPLQLSDLHIQ